MKLIVFWVLFCSVFYVQAACDDPAAPGVNWTGCDMSGMKLAGANLRGAILTRTNFEQADLSGARLDNVDLNFSDLSYANFSNASLKMPGWLVLKRKRLNLLIPECTRQD